MTESCKMNWVTISGQDCVENPKPAQAGDVVQDPMDLQIHLVESFLDVQDMLGRHLNEAASVTPQGPNGADYTRRPETASQQTNRVKILNPLAVGDIRLPARDILHVMSVYQVKIEATAFKYLVHRNPIDAVRLHGDRCYTAGLQPIRKLIEITSERLKPPHRMWIAVRSNSNEQLTGTHIDTGSVWMKHWQLIASSFALLWHSVLRVIPVECPGRE